MYVNMRSPHLICFLTLALGAFTGCSPQSRERPIVNVQIEDPRTEIENPGSSSGGGGFVDENSTRILQTAAKGLAKMIRYSSPEIYEQLPEGWTQEKLARIIESVRYEPQKEGSRERRQLMFDYGTDNNGPYILALKPFFVAYSSFPIKFAKGETLSNLMKDVRLKLAHETAHLFDLNEDQAEQFGLSLLQALLSDTIHCKANDVGDWPGALEPKASSHDWIFHRPSGIGLVNSLASWKRSYSDDEKGRIQNNERLARGEWAKMMEVKIHAGIGEAREDCRTATRTAEDKWSGTCFGPSQRSYSWELSPVTASKSIMKALDPLTEMETLTLGPANGRGQLKGTLIYAAKGRSQLGRFTLDCKSHFERLRVP
ncbi:MAG: hypothetical protein AB7G93_18260 [Bdellovibrionales bacterium]